MEGFTKYLKIADSIDIMIFKENDESITLSSFIYEIVDDEKLIMSHPIHQGHLYPLAKSNVYYFRFFIENMGMYLFKGNVKGRLQYDNLPSIAIILSSDIKKVQRRKFFRVHFNSTGYFEQKIKLTEEEITLKRKQLERKFPNAKDIGVEDSKVTQVKFDTLDLSGGGIRVKSTGHYEIGDLVEGKFKISSVWVDFKGEVTRVDKKEGSQVEVGIKFIDLSSGTQSKIVSYVFEIERNLIKKGLM